MLGISLATRRVLVACVIQALLCPWAFATAVDSAAPTDETPKHSMPLGLEAYEPNAFGYTKNNDDVHYENFKVSIQFPFMPKLTRRLLGEQNEFYFSFTGLFAFYIGDRSSGPVVGQEYNPQFFWKHLWSCNDGTSDKYRPQPHYFSPQSEDAPSAPPPYSDPSSATRRKNQNCYVTVGYNHDSNGQIINSLGQFQAAETQQGTAAAYDAISRGWDYIGINAKFIPYWSPRGKFTLYPMLKYFLADGVLQGNPEEIHDWEHPPDAKPRRDVDGLSLLAKYQRHLGPLDTKVAFGYTTGYERSFKYNTVRLELGAVLLELPIVFWTQNGYMSDLSRYYQRVTGYGVQIEIASF